MSVFPWDNIFSSYNKICICINIIYNCICLKWLIVRFKQDETDDEIEDKMNYKMNYAIDYDIADDVDDGNDEVTDYTDGGRGRKRKVTRTASFTMITTLLFLCCIDVADD